MAGTIEAQNGFRYGLTPEDLDVAARMLANEGGNKAADLFTMAQRFVLLHRSFPTFAAMLRAFSQPVNPKWLANGEFCRPGGRYAGTPSCSPGALAHRAEVQDPNTRYPSAAAYVARWAAGGVANPVPRATDFRADDARAHELVNSGQMQLVLADGNWYFADGGSEDWPENFVTVSGRGTEHGFPTGLVLGLGAAALVLGGAAYVAHEKGWFR